MAVIFSLSCDVNSALSLGGAPDAVEGIIDLTAQSDSIKDADRQAGVGEPDKPSIAYEQLQEIVTAVSRMIEGQTDCIYLLADDLADCVVKYVLQSVKLSWLTK